MLDIMFEGSIKVAGNSFPSIDSDWTSVKQVSETRLMDLILLVIELDRSRTAILISSPLIYFHSLGTVLVDFWFRAWQFPATLLLKHQDSSDVFQRFENISFSKNIVWLREDLLLCRLGSDFWSSWNTSMVLVLQACVNTPGKVTQILLCFFSLGHSVPAFSLGLRKHEQNRLCVEDSYSF